MGVKSGGFRMNSRFSQLSMYKIDILKTTFELIKDLDPEYYKELKEVFKDLSEED
jgi:hypothetical protein